MDRLERIIIKLIIIQLICLVLFQFIFHQNSFIELKKLAKYEGVNQNNYTKIIETFNDLQD
jgi:hypothetical protein